MPYTPLDQTRVLWDEKGKPYWASVDGKSRHYIPPIVAAQYRDDPRMLQWAQSQGFSLGRDAQGEITGMEIAPGAGAGGNRPLDFRSGRQWDTKEGRYDTDFDWGDVVTLGAGGLIGAGAASAIGGAGAAAGSAGSGGAAGGASGASGGITPALGGSGLAGAGGGIGSGIGGAGGATTAGTGAGLGGGLGAGAGGGAGVAAGAGASASALGSVTPTAASAGGSGLLDKLLSPDGLSAAAAIAASLAGRGNGMNDDMRASQAQAQRLQAITEARMRRVDPLHEAITQLAFGRLPVSSRNGLSLPRVTLPEG